MRFVNANTLRIHGIVHWFNCDQFKLTFELTVLKTVQCCLKNEYINYLWIFDLVFDIKESTNAYLKQLVHF